MARILNIDTSTEMCSVALADKHDILAYREIEDPRGHASNLAVFIDEILKELSITIDAIDAVAVSKGRVHILGFE
jgi:tRNA threonylcarbamoyladenosine biosynthesis protein TsaB